MLRGEDGDAALVDYCEALRSAIAAQDALREPVRVLLDSKPGKAAAKRWDWVRKGAPVIIEVGQRDMEGGKVSLLRRDRLWAENGKPAFETPTPEEAASSIGSLLADIQSGLFAEAHARREAQIERGIDTLEALATYFGEDRRYPGWAEVQWAKPTGAALDAVVEKLKALKLTLRNVPVGAAPASGTCIFTGDAAVERIYVARSY
ncbi:MAG: hypothetical protein RLZZ08_2014, partial [Pseudomonadota bacterium]|jgi:prolyl-tRNA synthetase